MSYKLLFMYIKRQTKVTNIKSPIGMIPFWIRREIPCRNIVRSNLDIRNRFDLGMLFMSLLFFLF
jgi:hypothetical protein